MSTRSKSIAVPVLQRAAPVFAALGDATRLRLVALLCAGGAAGLYGPSGASSGLLP